MRCPRCSAALGPESRFCGTCGLSLEETLAADSSAGVVGSSDSPRLGTSRASDAAWLSSSSSLDSGFAAGTLLLGRYRIVGLLGRGGMGEVYRADDLTLGQAVALKFLPRELAASPERLARFHAEVRIARSVSHPNVCRVYDIGDLGGQPFLSMEFVDGEDLSSLLRRIGRLPQDKAVDISRQICAGLTAAHAPRAFVSTLLEVVAITTDSSRWYAPSGAVALVATLALAIYAMSNTAASRQRLGF